MNLYKITIQAGDHFYVVAPDPTAAYSVVRKDLDVRDVYFSDQRNVRTIELFAEDAAYPANVARLYLSEVK